MASSKLKQKQPEITGSVINIPVWKMVQTMVHARRAGFSVSCLFISIFQASHSNKFN